MRIGTYCLQKYFCLENLMQYFCFSYLIVYTTMASQTDVSFIPDTPNGPLDEYRKRAKFNWKHLRLIFEDAKLLKLKYSAWDKIEANPLFAKPKHTLSADEQKYRVALQMNEMRSLNLLPPEIEKLSHNEKVCWNVCICLLIHDIHLNKLISDSIFNVYQ